MCRSGDIEDVKHLLITCPALADCRADFLHLLKHALPQAGVAGAHLRDLFLQHFLLHRSEALCLLLGSQPEFPACPVAMDQELYDEQCGKAAWLLDKVSKNYIVRCWRVRQSMIGTITIGEGQAGSIASVLVPDMYRLAVCSLVRVASLDLNFHIISCTLISS